MNRSTSTKITHLSFILCIFVIFIHCYNLSVYNIHGGALYAIELSVYRIAFFAVPVFFAISGYLYFRASQKDMKEKLKSRMQSIGIPFIVWGILYAGIMFALQRLPFISNHMNSHDTIGSLLISYFILGDNHLWYLRNLLIYVLIFYFLVPIIQKKFSIILIPLLILIHEVLRESSTSISLNAIYFFVGAYFASHFQEIVEKRYKKKIQIISTCCFILLCIPWVVTNATNIGYVKAPIACIGIILIWIMLDGLANIIKIKEIETISFFIYVAHVIVIDATNKAILLLFGPTLEGAWLGFFLSPIIVLIIVFYLYQIVRKNELIWKALTGGRGLRQ